MNRILIIDPIFRGSRLYYSWAIAEAFRPAEIEILTRTRAKTDHYHELFTHTQPVLHELIDVAADFWYGNLGAEKCAEIAAFIHNQASRFSHVIFSGFNELYPHIHQQLLAAFPSNVCVAGFEYDADFLLGDASWAGVLRRTGGFKPRRLWRLSRQLIRQSRRKQTLYRELAACSERFRCFVLDDRVDDPQSALPLPELRQAMRLLPDPPPFSPQDNLQSTSGGPVVVTLVGLQSRRKGINDVLDAVEGGKVPALVQLRLAGRLEPGDESSRQRLKRLAERVEWIEGFIPEDELREYYRQSDYIILPYTAEFNGSSGVMAYATALGTPLITTDHGCIGHRVKIHGLGATYPAGRASRLAQLLAELPARNSDEYQRWRRNCRTYAGQRTLAEFQRKLRQHLDD